MTKLAGGIPAVHVAGRLSAPRQIRGDEYRTKMYQRTSTVRYIDTSRVRVLREPIVTLETTNRERHKWSKCSKETKSGLSNSVRLKYPLFFSASRAGTARMLYRYGPTIYSFSTDQQTIAYRFHRTAMSLTLS